MGNYRAWFIELSFRLQGSVKSLERCYKRIKVKFALSNTGALISRIGFGIDYIRTTGTIIRNPIMRLVLVWGLGLQFGAWGFGLRVWGLAFGLKI